MDEMHSADQSAREALQRFEVALQKNIFTEDLDYQHTVQFHFPELYRTMRSTLVELGERVATKIEPLVNENNLSNNLPQLEPYDAFGNRIDRIIHHPDYIKVGSLIYETGLMAKLAKPGGITEFFTLFFLVCQAGEAGHNCPIACSAGIIRVLQKCIDSPNRSFYLEKLTAPCYPQNYTGAQFLTEIQGGSDVGQNTVSATKEGEHWRIKGEKWFCSNAGADLIFLTARYDKSKAGTQGLALFLIPAKWQGKKNFYRINRLKDKIGTRSMATGEIDFDGAYATLVGTLATGFHVVMDNVLHISRLFNVISVLGMARRSLTIASAYAVNRSAFSQPIINYPLVKQTLATIRAENTAMLAAIFATAKQQDQLDMQTQENKERKLLLRTVINFLKYFSARLSVEHIHQALGILAGNGAIENFSPIPRLLKDCIVCENWEGTHNVLRMQILKDILKYDVDKIYLTFLENEIATLNGESELVVKLTRAQKNLATLFKNFRSLANSQQLLQIELIVDKMAALYCGLCLLKEAINQSESDANDSKLDAYQFFSLIHFENTNVSYDQAYLDLITRISTGALCTA